MAWGGSVAFFFLSVLLYNGMLESVPFFYHTAIVTWQIKEVWLNVFLVLAVCIVLDFVRIWIEKEFFTGVVEAGIELNR